MTGPASTLVPAKTGPGWERSPERSNTLMLRVMTWIALTFGRRAARLLLHPISLYFVLCSPAARRHSKRFLGRALGRPARFADGYRHVHAFTATILDRLYLLRGRLDEFDVDMHGSEIVDAALEDGRGAFLVGAHLGSFEVMRVAMVMYPDNAQKINAALRAIAPDNEPDIIALGRMGSMLAVRDWLDGGGLAGMLADRRLEAASTRAGEREQRLDFLGQPAVFADGPFRLAALLRRRVLFMAGLYDGGRRYQVHFEVLADFSAPMDNAAREALIADTVRRYAARVEAACRTHPYNWFNFHDFWQEDAA
jgi:predicted LPLAT superfamily acyltransferase